MKINEDTIKNHVQIIRDHLSDVLDGLKNEASKEFFRNEARSIINHADFIIEECSEESEGEFVHVSEKKTIGELAD
jgi:hypothetical protein